MDKGQAHALLNQVKMGMYFPESKINEALYVTGDFDVHKIAPKACRSIYSRSTELGDCLSWSEDWNRKRNAIEGVEK